MTSTTKWNIATIGTICLLICTILLIVNREKNKVIQKQNTINTINAIVDTGRKHIDKEDSSITINQLVIDNLDKESLLKIKDKNIAELQKLVKKYEEKNDLLLAASWDTDTRLNNIKAQTIVKYDTITNNPIYESQFALGYDKINYRPWIEGSTIAGFDTTLVDLIIHNDYSLAIGKDKKSGLTYADLKSRNPYSDVDSLRIFVPSLLKPSKWGFGMMGGYGIMMGTNGQLYHGISLTIGFGRKF